MPTEDDLLLLARLGDELAEDAMEMDDETAVSTTTPGELDLLRQRIQEAAADGGRRRLSAARGPQRLQRYDVRPRGTGSAGLRPRPLRLLRRQAMHKQTYDGVEEVVSPATEEDIQAALRDPNVEHVTVTKMRGSRDRDFDVSRGKPPPKDQQAKRKAKRKAQKKSRKKNRR